MTTEEKPADAAPAQETPGDLTNFLLAYAGESGVRTENDKSELALFGNLNRPDVRFNATLKQPLRFREAMSALYAIVGSDYRYVPKDRTAYVAFARMRRETIAQGTWHAQQAYFSWLLRNDPLAYFILDPIVTVHPDQVAFEVFSKDEGTYALLGIDKDAFAHEGEVAYGTTNIDFSQAFHESIQQMRSYRETRLHIGKEAVKLATVGSDDVLEKEIRVPDSWLRGLLQVQSASTLPIDSFTMAPLDLYNALRHLRMNGDRKGKRRGLRIELVPGEFPRLVPEPWETVLPTAAAKYNGKVARVVRVWGRRRLMLVRKVLPFVQSIDVHLMGTGLPSFWVFRCGDMTLTLGLTGFTSANWSQAASFDLLLPRKTQTSEPLEKILKYLGKHWSADAKDLTKATSLKGAALLEALQMGCQQGRIMFDVAHGVYRLRPVTDGPLDLTKLEYRNTREKQAHDLLVRRGAVKIASEHRIAGAGLEVTGKVSVAEDKRDYRPVLLLADEGMVNKAECTCAFFRKQGLKAGPCTHLIAPRLAYAQEEKRRALEGGQEENLEMETRTFSKRDAEGADVVQVTLDRQRLKLRWGRTHETMRTQMFRYNSVDEARAAYFAKLGDLDSRGFLDATAG